MHFRGQRDVTTALDSDEMQRLPETDPGVLYNVCEEKKYLQLVLVCTQKRDTSRGDFFDRLEKNHMKQRVLFGSAFASAISHLLWDVFSTMGGKKRAVWNRDGWKVNINFRSQNLSVWCRLKPLHQWESSSVELLLARADVCGRESEKAAGGWSNCALFWSLGGKKRPSPLCIRVCVCVCALQWPPCPLMFPLMWFVKGRGGRILSHVPLRVKFTTSHLCICLNQRKLRLFDTRTGWKHFITSQTHQVFVWSWNRNRKEGWVYLCCLGILVRFFFFFFFFLLLLFKIFKQKRRKIQQKKINFDYY